MAEIREAVGAVTDTHNELPQAAPGWREAEPELIAMFGLTAGDVEGVAPATNEALADAGGLIRRLRGLRGMSARELADLVGLTQDKLSKVEHGTRRVTPREVPIFARALGVSVAQLLGAPSASRAGLFAFRADGADVHQSAARARVQTLWEIEDRLAQRGAVTPAVPHSAVRGLTGLVERRFTRPETAGQARRQGRQLAEEARRLLDLGSGPLGDLASLMERLFGVDVVLAPVDGDISGLCARDGDRVTVFANSACARTHVRFTLAHELGHHLFADPRPIIEESNSDLRGPGYQERRASAFAAHLLMPRDGVETTLAWLDVTKADIAQMNAQGVVAIGYLMAEFGASLPALAFQLADLRWLSFDRAHQIQATWRATDILRQVEHVFPEGRGLAEPSGDDRIPARLYAATFAAARHGLVGLHTVAQLLDVEESDDLFRLVMTTGTTPT